MGICSTKQNIQKQPIIAQEPNYIPRNLLRTPKIELLFRKGETRDYKVVESIKKVRVQGWKVKYSNSYSKSDNLNNKSLEDLGSRLVSHFIHLKKLNLKINGFLGATDAGFQVIASKLGNNLHNLQHLTLELKECYKVGDKGLGIIGGKILKLLVRLKEFKLSFGRKSDSTRVTDHSLEVIGSALAKHSSLKVLELNFKNCKNFSDRSLRIIASEIATHHVHLQKLILGFRGCEQITSEGFEFLIMTISTRLIHLRHLGLFFAGCDKISKKTLEMSTSSITSYFIHLIGLELNFGGSQSGWNENITDQCLEVIGINIGRRILLQQLALEINIGPRAELQQLTISFTLCKNITDKGLIVIASNIAKLFHLKQLTLIFKQSDKITDNGLKGMISNIINLVQLRKLTLNFSKYRQKTCMFGRLSGAFKMNITNEGVKFIAMKIAKHLVHLEQLTLKFKHRYLLKEKKESLMRILRSIPSLQINF